MKNTDILSRKKSGEGTSGTLFANMNNVVPLWDAPQSTSSVSNWKKRILAQLSLFRRGLLHEYDFEGELDHDILSQAEEFIKILPLLITAPVIGINEDGTILLEWVKHENGKTVTMFSTILNGQDIVFSLMHRGSVKTYGAVSYSEESMEMVSSVLVKYFENKFNERRITA